MPIWLFQHNGRNERGEMAFQKKTWCESECGYYVPRLMSTVLLPERQRCGCVSDVISCIQRGLFPVGRFLIYILFSQKSTFLPEFDSNVSVRSEWAMQNRSYLCNVTRLSAALARVSAIREIVVGGKYGKHHWDESDKLD